MARLAAVCVVELLVAVWLALQVFAAPPAVAPHVPLPSDAIAVDNGAAPIAVEVSAALPKPQPSPAERDTVERSGALGYSLELPVGDYVATITHADGRVDRRPVHLPAAGAELALQ